MQAQVSPHKSRSRCGGLHSGTRDRKVNRRGADARLHCSRKLSIMTLSCTAGTLQPQAMPSDSLQTRPSQIPYGTDAMITESIQEAPTSIIPLIESGSDIPSPSTHFNSMSLRAILEDHAEHRPTHKCSHTACGALQKVIGQRLFLRTPSIPNCPFCGATDGYLNFISL